MEKEIQILNQLGLGILGGGDITNCTILIKHYVMELFKNSREEYSLYIIKNQLLLTLLKNEPWEEILKTLKQIMLENR